MADLTNPDIMLLQVRANEVADLFDQVAEESRGLILQADPDDVGQAEYISGMMHLAGERARMYARKLDDDDDPEEIAFFLAQQELELNRSRSQARQAVATMEKAKEYDRRGRRAYRVMRVAALIAILCAMVNIGYLLGRVLV